MDISTTPVVLDVGNIRIWEIVPVKVGEYVFKLTSSSVSADPRESQDQHRLVSYKALFQPTLPCRYRITTRSEYEVFYASSSGLTIDAGFSEPVYRNPPIP